MILLVRLEGIAGESSEKKMRPIVWLSTENQAVLEGQSDQTVGRCVDSAIRAIQ